MEKTWFRDIIKFHSQAEQLIGDTPKVPNEEIKALRKRLIKEEVVEETLEAIENDDIEGIADGIVDSIVVLIGTAVSYGIDLEEVWDEIHHSNMEKFKNGVVKDEGGKVLKPEDWSPPNVKMILENQLPITEVYAEAKYSTEGSNWVSCYIKNCPYRAMTHLPNRDYDPFVDARRYVPYCKRHLKSSGDNQCQTSQTATQTQTTKTTNREL